MAVKFVNPRCALPPYGHFCLESISRGRLESLSHTPHMSAYCYCQDLSSPVMLGLGLFIGQEYNLFPFCLRRPGVFFSSKNCAPRYHIQPIVTSFLNNQGRS